MLEEILIAGFGGQGILSTGQLLAYAAMGEDRQVAWIPSYGPEMRGGTANCGVTISDAPISSPLVTEPTCLMAMNQPSFDAFVGDVVPGGLVIVNSSLVRAGDSHRDLRKVSIPANEVAEALGTPRVAANVLLGAYLALTGVVTFQAVVKALEKVLPERRRHLIPINCQALEQGQALAQEQLAGAIDGGDIVD